MARLEETNRQEKPREHCGVLGILCDDKSQHVAKYVYTGLMALQHRGQEAAGIAITDPYKPITVIKENGLVNSVLKPSKIRGLLGNVALGHVRYGTVASSSVENAQPFLYESNEVNFAIAFNGTITNYNILRKKLESKGHVFTTDVDTEVIATIIAATHAVTHDWTEIFTILMKILDGSFSIILMTENGDLYALRDPLGFKPLCIGSFMIGDEEKIEVKVLASETCAIDALSGRVLAHVKPGEIVHVEYNNGIHTETILKAPQKAFCFFEFVYFANAASELDGISVYDVRKRLGAILARKNRINSDNTIVVPCPDSGRSAALGYAQSAHLPFEEGLMKNRYITRTFIMPGQDQRRSLVNLKLTPVKKIIKGKDVILIDDSIVRGTTTRKIVRLLKQHGARSVHLRISCPPIRYPCYMGIDFPTREELIAANLTVDEICKNIGADSLVYQEMDGLLEAIGIDATGLCTACLNSKYPLKNPPQLEILEDSFTKNR
ncbi:amidophosphoribosyltransferase [Candidatus Bathyarchaeota archaeon]|nr:amidophosphoribosyltransferase [Candidatus Bathyarchaeota archaeon]